MERALEREREVPGWEELRCELWGGTFCSWLWGPNADRRGAQSDMGPSCLAQINPGGSRRVSSSFSTTLPPPHTHKGGNTHTQRCSNTYKSFYEHWETILALLKIKKLFHTKHVKLSLNQRKLVHPTDSFIAASLLFSITKQLNVLVWFFCTLYWCTHSVHHFFIKQMQHPSSQCLRGCKNLKDKNQQ